MTGACLSDQFFRWRQDRQMDQSMRLGFRFQVLGSSPEVVSRDDLGDFVSCRLLRDAVRLGFRNSAGPFQSFGRLAVQPRP